MKQEITKNTTTIKLDDLSAAQKIQLAKQLRVEENLSSNLLAFARKVKYKNWTLDYFEDVTNLSKNPLDKKAVSDFATKYSVDAKHVTRFNTKMQE